MSKPVVVIVGRPNVGKSTLFNRLTGYSKAIVKNVHGVTRDRNYSDVTWDDAEFTLVDTGGFFPDNEDTMFSLIRHQALYAVEEADVILHIVDGKEGVNPLDIELANIIRASGKKTLWIVNKIDIPAHEARITDFYKIGTDELIPISAESGRGLDDLMEKVLSIIPVKAPDPYMDYPKLAVVGRPNVGKSTLINTLLGKERMIVSSIAGTTRDSVDTICTYYGKKYVLIDTAGIRKKSRIEESVEGISVIKALKSIERADVAVVVLDAVNGIVDQDRRIIGIAVRREKGILLLFNKWDMVDEPEKRYKQLLREIGSKLWYAGFAPVLTTSALLKKRVFKIFPLAERIITESNKRLPTADLNKCMKELTNMLPTYKGKKIKLYYITQVGVKPPSFTLFLNHPEGIKKQHATMIEKFIREKYSFIGVPLKLSFKGRR